MPRSVNSWSEISLLSDRRAIFPLFFITSRARKSASCWSPPDLQTIAWLMLTSAVGTLRSARTPNEASMGEIFAVAGTYARTCWSCWWWLEADDRSAGTAGGGDVRRLSEARSRRCTASAASTFRLSAACAVKMRRCSKMASLSARARFSASSRSLSATSASCCNRASSRIAAACETPKVS